MEKRKFRFKKQFFKIDGIYNIPGYLICSGHGYAFETFCCKECGELFVVEPEYLHHQKLSLASLFNNKSCPTCKANLSDSLVSYPRHIFYNGVLLNNPEPIYPGDWEDSEIIEVYLLG